MNELWMEGIKQAPLLTIALGSTVVIVVLFLRFLREDRSRRADAMRLMGSSFQEHNSRLFDEATKVIDRNTDNLILQREAMGEVKNALRKINGG